MEHLQTTRKIIAHIFIIRIQHGHESPNQQTTIQDRVRPLMSVRLDMPHSWIGAIIVMKLYLNIRTGFSFNLFLVVGALQGILHKMSSSVMLSLLHRVVIHAAEYRIQNVIIWITVIFRGSLNRLK